MAASMNTQQAAECVRHPLKERILAELAKREASPSDLAGEWGVPLGDVSYHIRQLVKFGAIEQTRTRPVRGTSEHLYVAKVRIKVDVRPVTRKPKARKDPNPRRTHET
jgi:predicted transcriptional regulator